MPVMTGLGTGADITRKHMMNSVASKTEQAMEALTTMIRSGRYQVGDKLPAEPELERELGVSRTAVREAVKTLSFAGVLRVRQGDGTYVTGLEASELLRSVGFALDLSSPQTLPELYEIRLMLEPKATALAARRITADGLAMLAGHLNAMRAARDAEMFVAADAAFHDEIAAASGNEALRGLLTSLRSESSIMHIRRARDDEGATTRTIAEHEAILDSLEAGNAKRAEAAASEHLMAGERWLRRSLQMDLEN